MAPPVDAWVCAGSAESVEVGTADAKSRNPNDSVSTSTLPIVEQFKVAFVPGMQITTVVVSKLCLPDSAEDTRIGTALGAVLALGTADGSTGLTEVLVDVLVGLPAADALPAKLPVGDPEEEPPPPPQATALMTKAAAVTQPKIRITFSPFIASRRNLSLAEAPEANTPDR